MERRSVVAGGQGLKAVHVHVRTRVSACVATHSGIRFATDFTGFYIDAHTGTLAVSAGAPTDGLNNVHKLLI